MRIPKRDILVLLKNEFMTEQAIEHEVECLNKILRQTEAPDQFCIAHELVVRNRITSSPRIILKSTRKADLKAFRFLINKN